MLLKLTIEMMKVLKREKPDQRTSNDLKHSKKIPFQETASAVSLTNSDLVQRKWTPYENPKHAYK